MGRRWARAKTRREGADRQRNADGRRAALRPVDPAAPPPASGVAPLLCCGPEPAKSAIEALEENVGAVCALGRGVCYGEGPVEDATERCVDAQAIDARERALEQGEDCLEIYAEFFACAAQWTCDDFLNFLDRPDAPCQDLRAALNEDCPGLSPFSVDWHDDADVPGWA